MQTALIISAILVALFTGLFLFTRARIRNIPLVEDHEKILTLTDKNFQYQTKNKIVLVDFWAAWCAPCRMMAPVLNEVASELEGNSLVGKVDIQKYQVLAQRYQVRNIPTMILFKNGREFDRFVGVKSKDFLLDKIMEAR
jgi:thioredoxin 1